MIALFAYPLITLKWFFLGLFFLLCGVELFIGLIEGFFIHIGNALGEVLLILQIIIALLTIATLRALSKLIQTIALSALPHRYNILCRFFGSLC
jgi:hypothetical protein